MNLLGFAKDRFAAPGLYGCYGGLHLSIFDCWKPEFDAIIEDVKQLGMAKMGCNHCTGRMWAEKAATHGVPIIKGTDTYLSYPKRLLTPKAATRFSERRQRCFLRHAQPQDSPIFWRWGHVQPRCRWPVPGIERKS